MSTWFKSTPESEALLAEERLVLAATEMVYEAMEKSGKNKKQLAGMLGVRPSEVSQRLNGKRNLTLRTLAGMLHTLGMRAELSLQRQAEPVDAVDIRQRWRVDARPTSTYVQRPQLRVASGTAVAA